MQDRVKKLIDDYNKKITNCDKMLNDIESKKASARAAEDKKEVSSLNSELKLIYASRQAYVQAKFDIDSLLDFL